MGQTARDINIPQIQSNAALAGIPGWVPRSVQNYLDHTEMGVPIRALARQQGCHASTILRQIRRVETLRDDPLVDGVLKTLGGDPDGAGRAVRAPQSVAAVGGLSTEILGVEAMRVLRRLCETGAVLAVAADMEMGVIVRDGDIAHNTRTGVVARTVAEAMALKGWICAPVAGRITRYQITAAGRSALADMMARAESAQALGALDAETGAPRDLPRRIRYGLAESPLAALARRRDTSGKRFLSDALVRAGERLREDFELAQMEAEITRDPDGFLSGLRGGMPVVAPSGAAALRAARARVVAALHDLGPGLSDITLRCCCLLEGLETAEKRMGWSARSGKIVLRIALMQLGRHYAKDINLGGAMIG